jgi:uncharacterized membrane protein HdeD (DUF308 family)
MLCKGRGQNPPLETKEASLLLNPLAQAPIIHRSWSTLLLRGIFAIILGIIVLVIPGIALLTLIIVFGAYAFLDGILAVVVAIQERRVLPNWGWLLVEGIAGMILGIIAFAWPVRTALILLFIVAAWAIVTGVMEIAVALTVRSWLIGLAGVLSVAFGILLFAYPGAGLLSVLWVLGIYALAFGFILIAHAFQLRTRSASPSRLGEINF